MVAIAFYSITDQMKKFVVKTGLVAHEISDDFPQHEMKEKYILITPSYQDLKISLSFMEMAIYHSGFYAPLHLFGEGKLVRTTELTKLAIRATSFNAMYPGVKFRLESADYSEEKQQGIQDWTSNFVKEIAPLVEEVIKEVYTPAGWTEDALHYFHYTLNKNFMNLGFPTPYPEDEDSISSIMQQGLIKSADFEDFFYYADRNALTKYNKKQD